jgi:hypothetical protein
MSPPPPRRWKWHPWGVLLSVVQWLALVVVLHVAERDGPALLPPGVYTALVAVLATTGCVVLVLAVVGAVRGRARGKGPLDLGRPYDVEFEIAHNGPRMWLRVTVGPEALTLEQQSQLVTLGGLDPPLPERVPLGDVLRIDLQRSRIVLHVRCDGGEQALALVPRSYAERQRFVWEMAVRRADLFDAPRTDDTPGTQTERDRAGTRTPATAARAPGADTRSYRGA